MGDRITAGDVRRVFATLVQAADGHGYRAASEWVLQEGYPPAGEAWRVFKQYRSPVGRNVPVGLSPWPFREFIGWTPREAYHTLATILDVITADKDV